MGEHDNGVMSGAEAGFVPVDAPVERVELFEDRAAVTRRLAVPGPGRHQLLIGPVTPLIHESRLSFPSLGQGVVVEQVQVRRGAAPHPTADPEAVKALTERLSEARDTRAAAADAVRQAREAQLRARQAVQAAQDATVRVLQEQDDAAAWAASVQALAEHHGACLRRVSEDRKSVV